MFTLSGDSLDTPFGTQHVQGTTLDMSNPVLESPVSGVEIGNLRI